MNVAEEEVILWVTSDLCGTTSVQSSVVETTTVSGSAIPVALISRSQDELVDSHITETSYEDCKEDYCVVEDEIEPPKEKKSRKRGVVWNYFVPTEQDRAQCTFCSTVISYKGKSTNNLLRHLRTKHSENPAKENSKYENFQSEDGSTYYVLSTSDQIHSENSNSSFQDDEEDKNNKRRGGVWKYFSTGTNSRAKCKFCATIISFKGGSTTNLLRHMKSKHSNIKVPNKTVKPEGSFKLPPPKSVSIQHSFAEIVNECVKSDDEVDFTLHTVHYDGQSDDATDPISTEHITTLSSMDSFSHDVEVQPSEVIETTKERKKSAVAWKYFDMENEDHAKCSVCSNVISFKGGSTGNLLRHLKTKHSEIDLTQPEKKEEPEEILPENDDAGFDEIENQELAKFVQLLNPKYKLRGIQVPKLTEKELPKRIRKRGAALSYFTITENEYGTCQLCSAVVMLKNGSKAPLLRHLKAKHPDVDTVLVANSGGQSSSDEGTSILPDPIIQPNQPSVNIENIENIPMVTDQKDKITRKMRKRGLVWNHFAPLEDEKAKCSSCPAVISYKRGSTSNLLRHMKKKHPEIDVHDEDPLKEEDITNIVVNSDDDDDDANYDSGDGSPKKKILRKRGRVWNHFKPVGTDKAKCSLCSLVVVYLKGSTTNLLRHMKKKHPSIDLSKEKPFNKTLTLPKERPVTETPKQPTPSDFLGEVSSGEKVNAIYKRSEIIFRKHFDKFLNRPVSVTKSKLYDEQLAKMIVKQYCPFTIVESEDFKKFVQTVNPGYSLPSRKTISSRLIPELYEKCVEEVREHLRNVRYVTITTNGWTLANNECYISITAHFIDEECKFQSYLLDCFRYEEKHTAENLAHEIKNILIEWGLIHKVNAVVSDNAANMTAAIRLRSWRHIPCFANMLNLVIQAGLFEIRETHDKVKVLVDHFKKNPAVVKKLQTVQKELGLPETKLKVDDVSRWESTYDMFNRLLACKNALPACVDLYSDIVLLNEYEWSLIAKTSEILKPLFDISNEVSEKNITISKVIPLSRCIGNYLQKSLQDKFLVKEIGLMVSKMSDEVALRFSDVEDNTLLAESTLLDPRFKNQAFTNDQSYSNTYHSILQKACTIKVSENSEDGQPKSNDCGRESSIWEEFDSRVVHVSDVQNPENAAGQEIENYLQEPILARNADPLAWWRERKSVYPRLFEIMKQRLCIAATAVTRNFTNSGQLVCEKRNKLSASKVSMVLFLNHNL